MNAEPTSPAVFWTWAVVVAVIGYCIVRCHCVKCKEKKAKEKAPTTDAKEALTHHVYKPMRVDPLVPIKAPVTDCQGMDAVVAPEKPAEQRRCVDNGGSIHCWSILVAGEQECIWCGKQVAPEKPSASQPVRQPRPRHAKPSLDDLMETMIMQESHAERRKRKPRLTNCEKRKRKAKRRKCR